MKHTRQILFLNSLGSSNGKNAQIEMSILAGKKTRVIPTGLSKESLEQIFEVHKSFNFPFSKWNTVYAKLAISKFVPLVDEIPEPQPHEGRLLDLTLEDGGVVKLFVRSTRLVGNNFAMNR